MALEARLVASAAPALRVRRTGIGRRRALAAGTALREREPVGLLVVVGFAGGLDQGARAGEVVVPDDVRGAAGERVRCSAAELLAEVLLAGGIGVRRGPVASVPRPVLGRARATLREQTGAVAAEMETLWLAEGARPESLGVVRVIADVPSVGLWRPWRGAQRFIAACAALRRAASVLGAWASVQESDRVVDALGFEPSGQLGTPDEQRPGRR
jgi:nucleoside phosphorylase